MRIRYWRSDVCSPELDRRFHLVPVAEAVEQAELHGLLPAVGRAVDEVAHRAGFQVARFGHGGDDLRERRIEVALQVLALRLGQRVFGQETHGALVLLALGDLRLRADVVQQRPQERLLEGEAGDAELAGGLHPERSEEPTSELQSL